MRLCNESNKNEYHNLKTYSTEKCALPAWPGDHLLFLFAQNISFECTKKAGKVTRMEETTAAR